MLKPCPFCGSTIVGELTESSDPRDRLGVVGCGVCGASGPSICDVSEFVEQWNRREQQASTANRHLVVRCREALEWIERLGLRDADGLAEEIRQTLAEVEAWEK